QCQGSDQNRGRSHGAASLTLRTATRFATVSARQIWSRERLIFLSRDFCRQEPSRAELHGFDVRSVLAESPFQPKEAFALGHGTLELPFGSGSLPLEFRAAAAGGRFAVRRPAADDHPPRPARR